VETITNGSTPPETIRPVCRAASVEELSPGPPADDHTVVAVKRKRAPAAEATP
jgi:hypothetical protein